MKATSALQLLILIVTAYYAGASGSIVSDPSPGDSALAFAVVSPLTQTTADAPPSADARGLEEPQMADFESPTRLLVDLSDEEEDEGINIESEDGSEDDADDARDFHDGESVAVFGANESSESSDIPRYRLRSAI